MIYYEDVIIIAVSYQTILLSTVFKYCLHNSLKDCWCQVPAKPHVSPHVSFSFVLKREPFRKLFSESNMIESFTEIYFCVPFFPLNR